MTSCHTRHFLFSLSTSSCPSPPCPPLCPPPLRLVTQTALSTACKQGLSRLQILEGTSCCQCHFAFRCSYSIVFVIDMVHLSRTSMRRDGFHFLLTLICPSRQSFMQAFLTRRTNLRTGTDLADFPSKLLTSLTRYTLEETATHESVMRMVPTFKDVVTTLNGDPTQLEAFIAFVSTRIYAHICVS